MSAMFGMKPQFPGISTDTVIPRIYLIVIGSAAAHTLARLSQPIITDLDFENEKEESIQSFWPKSVEEEWSEAKNQRRCDLINRKYSGGLNPQETTELALLQEQMLRYSQRVAPLPIEAARRLYHKLLAELNGSKSSSDS